MAAVSDHGLMKVAMRVCGSKYNLCYKQSYRMLEMSRTRLCASNLTADHAR